MNVDASLALRIHVLVVAGDGKGSGWIDGIEVIKENNVVTVLKATDRVAFVTEGAEHRCSGGDHRGDMSPRWDVWRVT